MELSSYRSEPALNVVNRIRPRIAYPYSCCCPDRKQARRGTNVPALIKSGLYGGMGDLWRCSEERRSIGVKAPYPSFKAGAAIIAGEVVIPAADGPRRTIPMKKNMGV
jgi:hypothetical protein